MALILSRAMLAMSLNFRMMLPRNLNSPSSHITCSVGLGPNQACTLFGAHLGSNVVSGKDYLKAGYDLNTDDLWRRNFIVLLALFVFFWLTQTVVIEVFPVSIARDLFEISLTIRPSSNLLVVLVLASLRRIHPRRGN
jgi:hypothetical protein